MIAAIVAETNDGAKRFSGKLHLSAEENANYSTLLSCDSMGQHREFGAHTFFRSIFKHAVGTQQRASNRKKTPVCVFRSPKFFLTIFSFFPYLSLSTRDAVTDVHASIRTGSKANAEGALFACSWHQLCTHRRTHERRKDRGIFRNSRCARILRAFILGKTANTFRKRPAAVRLILKSLQSSGTENAPSKRGVASRFAAAACRTLSTFGQSKREFHRKSCDSISFRQTGRLGLIKR